MSTDYRKLEDTDHIEVRGRTRTIPKGERCQNLNGANTHDWSELKAQVRRDLNLVWVFRLNNRRAISRSQMDRLVFPSQALFYLVR